jgi:hypothetical protein
MRTVMLPIMKHAPKRLAMAAPVSAAAGRYLQALTFSPDVSGQFFASKPKKMTGALVKMEHQHFADRPSQEAVWQAVVHLTGADCLSTSEQRSVSETPMPNSTISP